MTVPSVAESLEHLALYGEPPYTGPRLGDVLSASHFAMLITDRWTRRLHGKACTDEPRFVHCFGCRVPVTPSGRKALITEPTTGSRKDVGALCGIIRHHRARLTPPAQSVAE